MSGGAMDYLSNKVREFTDMIETEESCEGEFRNIEARKWFKELMIHISEASHALEWVDSGDSSEERFEKEIENVKKFLKINID